MTRHLAFCLSAGDPTSGSHASTAEPLSKKQRLRSLWVVCSLSVGPDFPPASKEVRAERLCHTLTHRLLLPRRRFQHQEGPAPATPPHFLQESLRRSLLKAAILSHKQGVPLSVSRTCRDLFIPKDFMDTVSPAEPCVHEKKFRLRTGSVWAGKEQQLRSPASLIRIWNCGSLWCGARAVEGWGGANWDGARAAWLL